MLSLKALGSFTTFLKTRFWNIVFVCAVLYFVLIIRNDMIQHERILADRSDMQKAIESEKIEKGSLKATMASLKKASYVEELARRDLGYVKKGETAYKVLDRVN
jgi:cell division protein FtsB